MELDREDSLGLQKMQTQTRITGQVKKVDMNLKGFKDEGEDFSEEISAIQEREDPNDSFTNFKVPDQPAKISG